MVEFGVGLGVRFSLVPDEAAELVCVAVFGELCGCEVDGLDEVFVAGALGFWLVFDSWFPI